MSEVTASQPVPPSVAKAVAEAMGAVKRLAKTDTNKFANYQYASIDDFLAMTGPICAAAGLVVLADEDECEIVAGQEPQPGEKTKNTLRLRWAFTLAHVSGETYGPLYRTVIVPAAGAQAFGSSQSYALKQFLRGLLQIPTGDNDDPDAGPKGELPTTQNRRRQAPRPQEPTPEQSTKTPDDAEAAQKALETIAAAEDRPRLFTLAARVNTRFAGKPQLRELSNALRAQLFVILSYEARQPNANLNEIGETAHSGLASVGLLLTAVQLEKLDKLITAQRLGNGIDAAGATWDEQNDHDKSCAVGQ